MWLGRKASSFGRGDCPFCRDCYHNSPHSCEKIVRVREKLINSSRKRAKAAAVQNRTGQSNTRLLYSSLLGAVGAAVDNDEDAQQMVFPVTIPLILSIMLLFPIARNPEGPVAFWFSIIPLTSPVAMMARIPYGIPIWELLLSMFLLVLTTIGAIAGAAKIYRIGLLMYGKKVNIKELFKWLRYKN